MYEKRNSGRMHTAMIVLLWGGCLVSALGVSYTAFLSRKSTQELEVLRRESSSLQVVSGQYLLEKSTWAAYSRIERVAVTELQMKVPESKKTVLVYKQ